MARKYTQGFFTPVNSSKYLGDLKRIVYRSSWELGFMRWLDTNPGVIQWSSEEIIIPYICATDRRQHHYFPDFKVNFSTGRTWLVELKPKKEVDRPTKSSKPERVLTWVKNSSKWAFAMQYCEARCWEFKVLTEVSLARLGIILPHHFTNRRKNV